MRKKNTVIRYRFKMWNKQTIGSELYTHTNNMSTSISSLYESTNFQSNYSMKDSIQPKFRYWPRFGIMTWHTCTWKPHKVYSTVLFIIITFEILFLVTPLLIIVKLIMEYVLVLYSYIILFFFFNLINHWFNFHY